MVFEDNIRKLGIWDLMDASTLDDYAYYHYCKLVHDSILVDDYSGENTGSINQTTFKAILERESIHDNIYYKVACDILRKEKLVKIQDRINDI